MRINYTITEESALLLISMVIVSKNEETILPKKREYPHNCYIKFVWQFQYIINFKVSQ